eukprot:2713281-Amphidinium_carterae.1
MWSTLAGAGALAELPGTRHPGWSQGKQQSMHTPSVRTAYRSFHTFCGSLYSCKAVPSSTWAKKLAMGGSLSP